MSNFNVDIIDPETGSAMSPHPGGKEGHLMVMPGKKYDLVISGEGNIQVHLNGRELYRKELPPFGKRSIPVVFKEGDLRNQDLPSQYQTGIGLLTVCGVGSKMLTLYAMDRDLVAILRHREYLKSLAS